MKFWTKFLFFIVFSKRTYLTFRCFLSTAFVVSKFSTVTHFKKVKNEFNISKWIMGYPKFSEDSPQLKWNIISLLSRYFEQLVFVHSCFTLKNPQNPWNAMNSPGSPIISLAAATLFIKVLINIVDVTSNTCKL